MLGTASSWEFRWRFLILVGSQPALAVTASRLSDSPFAWYSPPFSSTAAWCAVAVATFGIWLRLQAIRSLNAHVMASRGPDSSHVVDSGVYGACRNPLYVSSLLLFGGYGLFFGSGWAAAFVVFHWLRYERIIRLEEAHLRSEWGEEYERYLQNVPRWWPRFRTLTVESGSRISLYGILANGVYVGMWAGLVASAVLGDLIWILPFELGGGLAMAFFYWRGTKRPQVTTEPAAAKPVVVVSKDQHSVAFCGDEAAIAQ